MKWPIYLGILIGYLWSTAYTKANHSWGKVFRGTWSGILNMWKVCVVLLLVGLIVALWMVSGTIPFLTDVGSTLIRSSNIIWITFLLSIGLSMLIGSSIATWGILGPPLLALTPPHWSAIVAGALVSGGMVGDRSSPMSTSVMVMSKAADMSPTQTLHQLLRTAIMPFLLSAIVFSCSTSR
ncbi:Na+/H+ antiporter NhaC family protein [Alicyclobacillus contaminans]|uniref:Na+/H+ antiporter NhaC family protein n=1 Tax=Alicyclobacillus contaminans TaxID=392016 RepID=UPI003CCC0B15